MRKYKHTIIILLIVIATAILCLMSELKLSNTDSKPMTNRELVDAVVGLVYKINEEDSL